jgi:hypothetical protein
LIQIIGLQPLCGDHFDCGVGMSAKNRPAHLPAPRNPPIPCWKFLLQNLVLEGITGIAISCMDEAGALLMKHHPLNPVIARSREDQMHLFDKPHFNTLSEQEFLPSPTSMRNPLALPCAPCDQ